MCMKDLSELEISESLEEIKNMTRSKYKNIIKSRIEKNALEYLLSKRGSKGHEIEYTSLEMSEYLLPFNTNLNIEEKRKMFEIRNRMTQIPTNFGKTEEKCICGENESLPHIYICESLNQMKTKTCYEEIYNGNLKTQIQIYRRMENNLERRKELKLRINFPRDLCDPLYCSIPDLDNE